MNAETARLLKFPEHPTTTAPLIRFSEPLRVLPIQEAILRKQQEVVRRQIEKNIELGFHEEPEINQTEDEYRQSFPSQLPQSMEHRGEFYLPLAVEPRISLQKQHRLAGISEFAVSSRIRDKVPPPYKPYIILVSIANELENDTAEKAVSNFQDYEVVCCQLEVTSFCIHNRKVLERTGAVFSTGSRFYPSDNSIPFIEIRDNKPRLESIQIYSFYSRFLVLSRTEEISKAA